MRPMVSKFPKSDLIKYVILRYQYLVDHFMHLLLIPIITKIVTWFLRLGREELVNMWSSLHLNLVQMLCSSFLIIVVAIMYFVSKPRAIYLVDYACFKPPSTLSMPSTSFEEFSRLMLDNTESVEFQMKLVKKAGLGEETCFPPFAHRIPPKAAFDDAGEEAKLIIFSAMDSLFEKTGLKPKDIDILIVNCSVFSPTPSLSSMVINKYGLRSDIKSFNLSGMGCSAGLISTDLARHLLQILPDSNAIVVSTEIVTQNTYHGNERSKLLSNCLFRMGGAAILLSNQSCQNIRAKYHLVHLVRTHKGADDNSYRCVYQEEDNEGNIGVNLSKTLIVTAGEAMKSNITTLAPLVLPISEQLRFILSKIFKLNSKSNVPNFKQAFKHFCIHPGGRAVIDAVEKNLHLSAEDVEASRMTLHRFGNTSSSSIWYELNYIESKGRMRRGDRVWQIAIGSGYKCNSAVWKCNRAITPPIDGAWSDSIDKYPVHIPQS